MFQASRIWCLGPGESIEIRPGSVALDPDDMPIDERDAQRALTVVSGLEPRDIAVFADHIGTERLLEDTIAGFVVTSVKPDGSGIIVHGDRICQRPRDWSTERVIGMWDYLSQIDGTIYDTFGLQALGAFIQSTYTSPRR